MQLNELINIASSAYPDGLIAMYWDFKRECPRRNPNGGDTLAQFIAHELADTYDGELTDKQQIQILLKALAGARNNLEVVCKSFTQHFGGPPMMKYRKNCRCGKVLVVIERKDPKAAGGKSLEFEWKVGAYTASTSLRSLTCPACGRTIKWNDTWQIVRGASTRTPYIWLQEDESEGRAKCGCRLVANLNGGGAAIFLCPQHDKHTRTTTDEDILQRG